MLARWELDTCCSCGGQPLRSQRIAQFSNMRLAALLLFSCLIPGCTRRNAAVSEMQGPTITGSVFDASGRPVDAAMVTVEGPSMNSSAITVYTDPNGHFATPVLGTSADFDHLRTRVQKIGWEQEDQGQRSVQSGDRRMVINFRMRPADNIAAQVPMSAWLNRLPEGDSQNMVVFRCAGCHQFPNPNGIAGSLKNLSVPDRERVWHDVINRMRRMVFILGPVNENNPKLRWGMTPDSPQFKKAVQPENSLISPQQENEIAPFLARYLPGDLSSMPPGEYKEAPTGAEGTVLKEYQLPPDAGWVREVIAPSKSDYVWAIDLSRSQMVRIARKDGSQTWFPVRGSQSSDSGPHTIALDVEGNIWITLDESQEIAKFNPTTNEWKVWGGFSKGALMHDFALTSNGKIGFDLQGRIWVTLIGLNKLASLNPTSGEVREYDLPVLPGQVRLRTALYGAAMASDHKHVWFSQLMGVLGEFNVETNQVETQVKFPLGTAPRRMAFDENDVLWVPLYGSGEILQYDTQQKREIGRYLLPDPSSAPYNLSYDDKRRIVWIGTANADRIFRFDPVTKRFTQYPLPRNKTFMRMFSLDKESGEVWTTYAQLPVGSGPQMVVMLKPGEARGK